MDFDELERQFGSGRPANVTGTASPSPAHDELVLEASRAAARRMRARGGRAAPGRRRSRWSGRLGPPGGRMRLLAKLTATLLVVLGAALGAAAYLFHGALQRDARQQALHDAQLMMEVAHAVRSYTVHQVRPAIERATGRERHAARRAEDASDEPSASEALAPQPVFHPQTVPAFATTETFAELRRTRPGYLYKEAALNPTNQRNRASRWEEDLIGRLQLRSPTKALNGEHETPLGRSVFLAEPIRAQKACLECHGTPAKAPPGMLQLYGTENGFGWREGDVVAAQIVSVPVPRATDAANDVFRRLLLSLTVVGVVALVVLDLVLYAVVIRPARAPGQPASATGSDVPPASGRE